MDYKPFTTITLEAKSGKRIEIDSISDAARFLLDQWPVDPTDNPTDKLLLAARLLDKCLKGEVSARLARVAFVEAAREAGIFVPAIPPLTRAGKPTRWQFPKPPVRRR